MLRPFRVLLLAFIAVPLLEIFLFVQVGERIGAWPTVGLVVLTAILGVALLQMQGLETWSRAQMSLLQGGLPAQELLPCIRQARLLHLPWKGQLQSGAPGEEVDQRLSKVGEIRPSPRVVKGPH